MKKTNKQLWYVVFIGMQPGIYPTWKEADFHVTHYPGARHKSYGSYDEAVQAYKNFLDDPGSIEGNDKPSGKPLF